LAASEEGLSSMSDLTMLSVAKVYIATNDTMTNEYVGKM
jgi:hypothetical protein